MLNDRILTPSKAIQTETVGTEAAGTAAAVGERKIFSIAIDGKAYWNWGGSGVAVAATNSLLPTAGVYTFASGSHFTHIRIFNPSTTASLITSVTTYFNS